MSEQSSVILAMELANRGFTVVPLHERTADGTCSCFFGKNCPMPKFHLRSDRTKPNWATTERDVITAWWSASPKAVVGIMTGSTAGVIAVECSEADAVVLAQYGELGERYADTDPSKSLYLYRSERRVDSKKCLAALRDAKLFGEADFIVAPVTAKLPESLNVKSLPNLPSWLERLANCGTLANDDVREFPVAIFPLPVQRLLHEGAAAISCPVELIGIPVLGVLASAIGAGTRVEVKAGYLESSCIYATTVAPPASGKTPAMKLAAAPIYRTQKKLNCEWQRAKIEYANACHKHHVEVLNWKETRRRFSKGQGPDPGLEPLAPVRPSLTQMFTTDATIEAIGTLLTENDRGILCIQDELKAWLQSKRHTDWLGIWSSTPIIVNRKSDNDPLIVDNPVVSVIGNLTPTSLEQLNSTRDESDGFIDRILFAFPAEPRTEKFSRHSVQTSTEEEYCLLYQKILAMNGYSEDSLGAGDRKLHFTEEAFMEYANWAERHRVEISRPDVTNILGGMLAKLEAYCARFALILHLSRAAAEETDSTDVDAESVRRAIMLAEYFKQQARRVLNQVGAGRDQDQIKKVLAWIRKKGSSVSLRKLQNNNVGGIRTAMEGRALLMKLESLGYGFILQGEKGSVVFRLYPQFIDESEESPDSRATCRGSENDLSTLVSKAFPHLSGVGS